MDFFFIKYMCIVSPKSPILISSRYDLLWENTQFFLVKTLDVNRFIKKYQDSEKQTKNLFCHEHLDWNKIMN